MDYKQFVSPRYVLNSDLEVDLFTGMREINLQTIRVSLDVGNQ